ncbi:alpha/beta hydrolase [Nocardiopsis ansamitocini]|uniref:Esterase n=1 Tax=Nocardiopsis ansamitocini TaxID=1670832 RepID=A0A9W6P8A6_9ACTN|nr:alpha/beta hydrolase [Nocardiopsis ansamitocini]GLU48846.1 esterase [Nocardiopsis ansamitocini]
MSYAFDPELAPSAALLPPPVALDPQEARTQTAELSATAPEPDTGGIDVQDLLVPGPVGAPDVAVRVYRPQEESGPLPAVYDIHGGGFIMGGIDAAHPGNVELARDLGAVVASVEYRLAPEAPFPAPLEDCYAGLVWLADNATELEVDPDRVALHGISAGGGLAAALTLLARDRGGPSIAFQYLGVPELDDRLATPSMRAFTDTPMWNRPNADVSWNCYLGEGVAGSEDVSPYAAPARATDLAGLPPAYISAMQFDPLRDEGIAYAMALLAAGVTVELHVFPGTFHGSVMVKQAEVSRREATERLSVLRRALHGVREDGAAAPRR